MLDQEQELRFSKARRGAIAREFAQDALRAGRGSTPP